MDLVSFKKTVSIIIEAVIHEFYCTGINIAFHNASQTRKREQ